MHKYKKFLLGLFFISFLFLFPQEIYAAVNVTAYPASVVAGNEMSIVFSATSLKQSTNYNTKIVGGPSDYAVQTWDNSSSWLSWNDPWSSFPQTQSNPEGSASATLKARFKTDTAPGINNLKVRIREVGGNTNIDSDYVQITVSAPTPSPSPTPTATSVSTSTPTATSASTATPASTKTPTPKPSPTKSPSPEPSSSAEVLGENTSAPSIEPSPEVTSEAESTTSDKKKFPFLPVILIGSGLSMVGLAVLQLMNAAKNSKKDPPLASPDNMGGSDI